MLLRWAMLAAATWAALLVVGLDSGGTQPSTMRVGVVAVVGLLAPLWWPGRGNGPWQTLVRVLGWSAAAAVLAAMLLMLIGGPRQSWAPVAGSCLMLLALLLCVLKLLQMKILLLAMIEMKEAEGPFCS